MGRRRLTEEEKAQRKVANREYMRNYHREYCKRKPEVCRKATYKTKGIPHNFIFKVSEEVMRATITACEICGKVPTAKESGLALDHCHVTGHVRGLLCFLCNTALGKFKDDPARLLKAHEYLQRSVSLAPQAI